jgi:prepilin-type N-terminal cleavage/methylation domain-containing protein
MRALSRGDVSCFRSPVAPVEGHRRDGFTLIELTIVIAMVAIMSSLAMPTVQVVRRLAVSSKCGVHLRQMGLAFTAYATEWEGQYPAVSRNDPDHDTVATSDAWYDRLPDYLDAPSAKIVMQCAGYRAPTSNLGFAEAAPKSFKMNGTLTAMPQEPRHWLLSAVHRPDELLLMVDSVSGITGVGQWGYAGPTYVTDVRHRGSVNGLAADGATWLRRSAPAVWRVVFTWDYPG